MLASTQPIGELWLFRQISSPKRPPMTTVKRMSNEYSHAPGGRGPRLAGPASGLFPPMVFSFVKSVSGLLSALGADPGLDPFAGVPSLADMELGSPDPP